MKAKRSSSRKVPGKEKYYRGGIQFDGYGKPVLTPNHSTKKGAVLVNDSGRPRLIRFGAQGYKHNYSAEGRRKFRQRHAKNIAKGRSSAAYWADRVFWAGKGGHTKKTTG